jgi:transglutaminase-like putative cysteine protease
MYLSQNKGENMFRITFNRIAILFFFLSLTVTILDAQALRAKWGEVSKADLAMKKYDKDTSASALVLSDFGETKFDDELNLVYNRHLRIKFFNTKGYDWGTHVVYLYTEKRTEQISKIAGITYNLDGQGNIVETELDDDGIFEEKLDNSRMKCKITMPKLSPGCIIDIKYKILSQSFWYIRDWTFQYDKPVRWSEYIVTYPRNIQYSGIFVGYEPFEIREGIETKQKFSSPATSYLGLGESPALADCFQLHYAVKDLPALRDEPYITTMEDYYNRMSLQLSTYSLVGTGIHNVLNDWQTLVNDLVKEKYFCERIDDTRAVRKKTEELTNGLNTEEEKINAIYNWITKAIVWDGKNRIYAEKDVDDVLESSSGNSAEISFLFLSMLKCAGIEGEPVILSTRNHGKIQNLYPILSQFNYVVSRVKQGNQYKLIDPTDPMRPGEILPPKILNTLGVVIKKDSVKWLRIASPKVDKRISSVFIEIFKDGSIKGDIDKKFTDYGALIARLELKDTKELKFAKEELETESSGINIDSVNIVGKDNINDPLVMNCKISSETYAQSNGEFIYINPHIIDTYKNNPFKAKTRRFSIDYSFCRNFTTIINLIIPEGYEIKDPLFARNISGANGALIFSRTSNKEESRIQIVYKFSINSIEIKPNYYDEVKRFYEEIIAAETEQIVLAPKKNAAPIQVPVSSTLFTTGESKAEKEMVKGSKTGKKNKKEIK